MNTKGIILSIAGIIVGAGLAIGFYYYFKISPDTPIVSSIQTQESPKPTTIPLAEYINPSGFTFQYPETATISENEEDTAAYGSITVSSSEYDGTMTMRVSDTTSSSAQDWLDDNTTVSKNADVTTIPFADIDAVQVATSGGIITVSYDQGALFVIRLDWDDQQDFWQEVYDAVISSFAFVEPEVTNAPASAGNTSSGIIFEGEEIIE